MSHLTVAPASPAVGEPSYGEFRYVGGTLIQRGTAVTAYVDTFALAPQLKAAA